MTKMAKIMKSIITLLTMLVASDVHADDSVSLWDSKASIQGTGELPVLEGVRFSVIKPYEFTKDGYRFLHGVALCFHKDKLYASFGHNRGGENTDSEEARWCVSADAGDTWSDVKSLDSGIEEGIGVSHGAFLSHDGRLWAFQAAYHGIMKDVHTRVYVLDENTDQWRAKSTVIGGFWPMQQPQKMDDGNWIMAGLKVGDRNPAIVAISHGSDFTNWDVIPIPVAPAITKMWGESTVIVDGKQVLNISRYGAEAKALVAVSEDYGRTWSEMRPSNLPMATSKPCAGVLSNGQRYLICTTTADSGSRRSPLTIAVTRPGEAAFSEIFVIRHAEISNGPGESHAKAALAYPYAIEHGGQLYVGYSNSGGGVGRVGKNRELWNNNSAELAIIPLEKLQIANVR